MSKAPKYLFQPQNQIPAIWGVGEFAYSKKDRNPQGEFTGRKLYISEAKYLPPTTPGAHYTDDKWLYHLRDGPGEKAQDVYWAEDKDLSDDDPRWEHEQEPLIDFLS